MFTEQILFTRELMKQNQRPKIITEFTITLYGFICKFFKID